MEFGDVYEYEPSGLTLMVIGPGVEEDGIHLTEDDRECIVLLSGRATQYPEGYIAPWSVSYDGWKKVEE